MSFPNYAKKLINEGWLVCEPRLMYPHVYQRLWVPDFMESIVFFAAEQKHYQSALHFFWQSIFHQREVTNRIEAEEIIASTHLHKITNQQAHQKIQHSCPQWYQAHKDLIPEAKWTNVIWDDAFDLMIVFEDKEKYYAWGWDTTA